MDTTRKRTAFTLVELLVVITIIGILASLIVVAAVGALKKGQETRIKAELNQIGDAIQETKNKVGSYPPNCQTDGTDQLNETQVLADLKRYMKQVAPRANEPPELIAKLAGLAANGNQLPNGQHPAGGMTAGEAIVFWLGGFSSDPKYPISGEGGPSYVVVDSSKSINIPAADRRKSDPVQRKWVYPFEVARLAPRAEDGYFDDTDGRFIEYQVTINGVTQTRRINLWQYIPAKSKEPFLYFDTSRHPAGVVDGSDLLGTFDPPAATALTGLGNGSGLMVYAFKKRSETVGANQPAIQYIDPEKFQILHCGNDDVWGEEQFKNMSPAAIGSGNPDDYLLFPNGPFIGDIADTIVNFVTQTRIEDAQPQ